MQLGNKPHMDLCPDLLGKQAPELANYHQEPKQMRSAAIGKSGYLKLKFKSKLGKTVLYNMERKVPLMVQKALYWDEKMPWLPCVTIISTSGCILQGDRLTTVIDVGDGASAHVTTQSATKIHSMDQNYASQTQLIRVGKDGYLEYMPDQIIPHRNSRFINETVIECATNSTVIFSEILMSGRKFHHEKERFGFDVYSSKITLVNQHGTTLFTEKMLLQPNKNSVDLVGIISGYDIYGNVVLIADKSCHQQIIDAMPPFYSDELCYGINRLPNEAGLMFKILANDSSSIKYYIREFWRLCRKQTIGCELPTPFIWKT